MAIKLNILLNRIEARPHSFYFLMALALFVGIMRATFEGLFFRAQIDSVAAVGMAGFYFGIGISLTFLLTLLVPQPWERVENSVHIGLFLGIFPPFIDLALNGIQPLTRYTYFLLSDLSLFPPLWYAPHLNIPAGEAATVWLAIAFSGGYVALKTRSWWRTLLALAGAYAVMFLHMAVVPSLLVKLSVGEFLSYTGDQGKARMVNAVTALLPVLHMLIGAVLFFLARRTLWAPLLLRGIHILPFMLLTFLGASLRGGGQGAYLATAMVWLCFWTAILQNDYFDTQAGEKTEAAAIRRSDVQFFNIVAVYLLFWVFILKNPAVLPMVLILVLAWLYHHPDYRIKKYLYGAIKMEGMWGALSLVAGFLVSPGRPMTQGELLLLGAVFGGWSLCAPLKDYKDVRSDARVRNYTLYQFFIRRGIGLSRGHRFYSVLILLLFSIPAIFFAANRRIPEAIILFLFVVPPLAFLLRRPPARDWFKPVLGVISLLLVLLIVFVYWRVPFSV